MSEEPTVTIMFRGLMVSHLVPQDESTNFLEIGVHHIDGHTLRFQVVDKNTKETLAVIPLDAHVSATSRNWHFEVENPKKDPIKPGVTFIENQGELDRIEHDSKKEFDEDFRWIIDLEAEDFYPQGLAGTINTAALHPVLRVPFGSFRTTEKAKVTRQVDMGEFRPFGSVAANTGCDIPAKGDVILRDDAQREILRFRRAPNIYYEIVNTPPEPASLPAMDDHPGHGTSGEKIDHFQFYYDLLPKTIGTKFGFQEEVEPNAPEEGPRPQLCGKVFMSKTTTPF